MILRCTTLFTMIIQMIFCSVSQPRIYEVFEDVAQKNVEIQKQRTIRLQHRQQPEFSFKNSRQPDLQKDRYRQQQKVDSYVQAYEQQLSKKLLENHQQSKNIVRQQVVKQKQQRQINREDSTKQIPTVKKSDWTPIAVLSTTEQPTKVRNSRLKTNKEFEIFEDDQESSASSDILTPNKHSRVGRYAQYPLVLSPNYLTGSGSLPVHLAQNVAVNYAQNLKITPQNVHGYTTTVNLDQNQEGQSDLDALNLLIGKNPSDQLQGLNSLLTSQSLGGNEAEASFYDHNLGVDNKQNLFYANGHALYVKEHIKDHTPITENQPDIENPQTRPNVKVTSSSQADGVVKLTPTQQISDNLVEKQQLRGVKNFYAHEDENHQQYAAQYAFGYRVRDYHSGNDFGHEEKRNGDVAKGHYHVLLPDGRVQNVNYYAGPEGYHATVTYSNAAVH